MAEYMEVKQDRNGNEIELPGSWKIEAYDADELERLFNCARCGKPTRMRLRQPSKEMFIYNGYSLKPLAICPLCFEEENDQTGYDVTISGTRNDG